MNLNPDIIQGILRQQTKSKILEHIMSDSKNLKQRWAYIAMEKNCD